MRTDWQGAAVVVLGVMIAGCGDGGVAAAGAADFLLVRDLAAAVGDLTVPDLAPAGDLTTGPGALIFADEFEGPAGTAVDGSKWVAEVGGGGWGNQEREYYTDSTDNARLDGSGHLAIVARAATSKLTCWYGTCGYTSARLKTQGKFAHAYGRAEARLKVPAGQGLWPAFWMLGDDIGQAGWPTCGEIDVVENIGREPALVHGTVHGPGYSGGASLGGPASLPGGAPFAADFHVYAAEWSADAVRFSVDGAVYKTVTPADLPGGARWVYDHPFFLLLNLAVGGAWPGDPDRSTPFPATLLVDYVRFYAG